MKRKRKYRLRAVMALLMALSILFSFKNSVFANEPQEIDAKSVESIEIANADDISYENDLKEAKNITDLDLESIGGKANISISENRNGFINYSFISKTPLKITTYRSGDIDETYSVISMAVRSDTTAGADESIDNGDRALWGRMEFIKRIINNGEEYCKMTAVETKAYNFRETGVHDLSAHPLCWGQQGDGGNYTLGIANEEGNPLIIASPKENTVYRKSNLGFQYFYSTYYWGILKCDFLVKYKHGNSEYVVSVTTQYGNVWEPGGGEH